MPLIKLHPKNDHKKPIHASAGNSSVLTDLGDMTEMFSLLMQKKCIHFRSDGQFCMHDFLLNAIDYLNIVYNNGSPIDIYLTTFSMTEFSARILAQLKDNQTIHSLHVLIDKEARNRYPNVNQILTNICDSLGHISIHAKVLLISKGDVGITLLSSANWTKNPRIEVGVVDATLSVLHSHREWIIDKIKASHD